MFFGKIWPCLHLVVNPLFLLWWSLLLIVDFDSDMSTSWRVCFSWLDVVKRFFFTTERSTTLHNCGPPWISSPFYVAELSSAFFFLRMYQTVDLAAPHVLTISLMEFCFWCPTIVCFSCMKRFFDCMMWVQSNSFQIQMAHLESTPDVLPA